MRKGRKKSNEKESKIKDATVNGWLKPGRISLRKKRGMYECIAEGGKMAVR